MALLNEFSVSLLLAMIASSILLSLVAVKFRPRGKPDAAALACAIFVWLGWLVAIATIVAKCA